MLLVRTKVKESRIHGIGLFADQAIKKGTEVWRYTPGFDQKFTREQILAFPDALQIFIYTYIRTPGVVRRVACTVSLLTVENISIIWNSLTVCLNTVTTKRRS